jgi:hypothetical protein
MLFMKQWLLTVVGSIGIEKRKYSLTYVGMTTSNKAGLPNLLVGADKRPKPPLYGCEAH